MSREAKVEGLSSLLSLPVVQGWLVLTHLDQLILAQPVNDLDDEVLGNLKVL